MRCVHRAVIIFSGYPVWVIRGCIKDLLLIRLREKILAMLFTFTRAGWEVTGKMETVVPVQEDMNLSSRDGMIL